MTSSTPSSVSSIRTISAPAVAVAVAVAAVVAVVAVAAAAAAGAGVVTPLNGLHPFALDGLCALFPLPVHGLWGFYPVNP